MLKTIMLFLALLFSASALASFCQPDTRITSIASIYDGDTIHVNIAGWPPVIGHDVGVRIRGIDTPEMHDKRPEIRVKAIGARSYVMKRLNGNHVIVLRHIGRDKYFRLLANVEVDGQDLGTDLLKNGLARPYDGGEKSAW